jgi:hypothetical protein
MTLAEFWRIKPQYRVWSDFLIRAEFFDIGEASCACASTENSGDDVNIRIEASLGVFTMAEPRVLRDLLTQSGQSKDSDEDESTYMNIAGSRATEFRLKFAGFRE